MLIKNVPHNQVLDMAKVLTAGKGQVSTSRSSPGPT